MLSWVMALIFGAVDAEGKSTKEVTAMIPPTIWTILIFSPLHSVPWSLSVPSKTIWWALLQWTGISPKTIFPPPSGNNITVWRSGLSSCVYLIEKLISGHKYLKSAFYLCRFCSSCSTDSESLPSTKMPFWNTHFRKHATWYVGEKLGLFILATVFKEIDISYLNKDLTDISIKQF